MDNQKYEIPYDHLPAINFGLIVYDRSSVEIDEFDHGDVMDRLMGNYTHVGLDQTDGAVQDVESETFEIFAFQEDIVNMYYVLEAAMNLTDTPEFTEPMAEAQSYIERNLLDDGQALSGNRFN